MQYPNNIKKSYTKLSVSHSNRGMNLENALNISNEYYLRNHIDYNDIIEYEDMIAIDASNLNIYP